MSNNIAILSSLKFLPDTIEVMQQFKLNLENLIDHIEQDYNSAIANLEEYISDIQMSIDTDESSIDSIQSQIHYLENQSFYHFESDSYYYPNNSAEIYSLRQKQYTLKSRIGYLEDKQLSAESKLSDLQYEYHINYQKYCSQVTDLIGNFPKAYQTLTECQEVLKKYVDKDIFIESNHKPIIYQDYPYSSKNQYNETVKLSSTIMGNLYTFTSIIADFKVHIQVEVNNNIGTISNVQIPNDLRGFTPTIMNQVIQNLNDSGIKFNKGEIYE